METLCLKNESPDAALTPQAVWNPTACPSETSEQWGWGGCSSKTLC